MEKMKDGNEPLHPCHTFLSQRNKVFVSNRRKKHFHQYTNPQPDERSNDFLHLLFHCDIHDRDKFRGSAISLFPFHVSAHCLYVCAAASQDFVAHKKYPAYRGRGDNRASLEP